MNTPLSKIVFSVLFVAVTASASAKAFAFPAQPGYFALDMECNSQYTPRNDLSTCVDEYSHSFKIYGMGTPSDFIPIGIEATGLVHLAFVQDSTSQQRCQQQQQQQQH